MKSLPFLVALEFACSLLSAQIIELPNVDFLAPLAKVHNDTTDYWVGGLRTPMDRNLEDVLRRIPGISILGDGTIYYGSDPISHFYIEGMDLLGGDYTLATRHIRPEDIDTISVLERHQPIRALQGVEFNRAAALNLRIKPNRHLHPIGYVQEGAGTSDNALGILKGHTLLIEANRQQLAYLSGLIHHSESERNNSTIETDTQLETFKSLFNENLFGQPSVPEQRVVDNQSAEVSYNVIQKFKNDWQIKAKANYDGEHKVSEVNRQSELYIGEGSICKDETNNSIRRRNSGCVKLDAQRNASDLYFTHVSTLTYSLKNNSYSIKNVSTGDILESLYMPLLNYRGETMVIFNKGDNQCKIETRFALTNAPEQRMTFGYDSLDVAEGCQVYKGTSWAFEVNTGYQYAFKSSFYVGTTLFVRMNGDHLQSQYEMQDSILTSSALSGLVTRFIAKPYAIFSHANFRAKFNTPVIWYLSRFEYDASTQHFHKPFMGLDCELSYKWTPALYTEINAGMQCNYGNVYDYMQKPFRTSYLETVTYGAGVLDQQKNWYGGIMLWYRNPILGKSTLLTLSYNRYENSIQRRESVSDAEIRSTTKIGKNFQHQFSAILMSTKNFYDQHLTLKLNASYMFINQEYNRTRLPLDVNIHHQDYKLTLKKSMLSKRLSIQLTGSYGRSLSLYNLLGRATQSYTDKWTAEGKISLMLTEKWEFYTSFQSQWLNQQHWHRDKYWDGGVRWFNGDHEVEISATNLLNNQHWITQQYSGPDSYRYDYRLRPLEITCAYKYKF